MAINLAEASPFVKALLNDNEIRVMTSEFELNDFVDTPCEGVDIFDDQANRELQSGGFNELLSQGGTEETFYYESVDGESTCEERIFINRDEGLLAHSLLSFGEYCDDESDGNHQLTLFKSQHFDRLHEELISKSKSAAELDASQKISSMILTLSSSACDIESVIALAIKKIDDGGGDTMESFCRAIDKYRDELAQSQQAGVK